MNGIEQGVFLGLDLVPLRLQALQRLGRRSLGHRDRGGRIRLGGPERFELLTKSLQFRRRRITFFREQSYTRVGLRGLLFEPLPIRTQRLDLGAKMAQIMFIPVGHFGTQAIGFRLGLDRVQLQLGGVELLEKLVGPNSLGDQRLIGGLLLRLGTDGNQGRGILRIVGRGLRRHSCFQRVASRRGRRRRRCLLRFLFPELFKHGLALGTSGLGFLPRRFLDTSRYKLV